MTARHSRFSGNAASILFASLLLPLPVFAGGDADWVIAGTGFWTTPENWSGKRVPDANFGDEPVIDTGGTAQVVGSTPPTFGLLTLGLDNAGTLEISNGGVLDSDASAVIARNMGSSGTLSVSGAGSNLTLFKGMRIGRLGSATIVIEAGGELTSNTSGDPIDTIIAGNPGSIGSVTIRGTGSSGTANDDLRIAMPPTGQIGSGGTASLVIEDGGLVISEGGTLSRGADADATVTVRDSGSHWNAGNFDIFIGSGGDDVPATLSVETGGRVSADELVINPSGPAGNRRVVLGGDGAPGFLDVRRVFGAGSGGGVLEINHAAADYHLTADGTAAGTAVTLEADLTVNHTGPGTTVIVGDNETNGTFNINAGTFAVDGSFFAGGFFFDPVFNVNAGGTLGGTGRVADVFVASGGTIAPGRSIGTLTTDDLVLNQNALLEFELSTPGTIGAGVNDLIESGRDLTLDGTLNITEGPGFGAGIYRLFNYSRNLVDNGLEIGSVPVGFDFQIDTSTSGQVDLVVSSSSASALLLPERIGFANLEPGQSSAPEPLLLTSKGPDPLQVQQVSIVGSGAAAYALTEDLCSGMTLAAGADCDLAVVFAPAGLGLRLARLEVTSNDPDGPAIVPLSGIGVAADNIFADSFD